METISFPVIFESLKQTAAAVVPAAASLPAGLTLVDPPLLENNIKNGVVKDVLMGLPLGTVYLLLLHSDDIIRM